MDKYTLGAMVLTAVACLGGSLVLLWKANTRLVWERTNLQKLLLKEKQTTGTLVDLLNVAQQSLAVSAARATPRLTKRYPRTPAQTEAYLRVHRL